jgi:hypothetical protein
MSFLVLDGEATSLPYVSPASAAGRAICALLEGVIIAFRIGFDRCGLP